MGNAQSTVTDIVNKTAMNVTNNFITTNIATTQADSINTQTFTLNIGVAKNCPIHAGQTINSSVTSVSTLTNNKSADLATSLTAVLNAAVDSSSGMINGLAAMTGGNSQTTSTSIKNTIQVAVTNTINDTNINDVVARSVNTQTMTLNMAACEDSPIEANQGIVSNVIAQNILTQITSAIIRNSLIAQASSNVKTDTSMHNSGLNELVDSIGKALSSIIGAFTGPAAACWIAGVVLCCVCCLGLVYFLMSPAGQNAASSAANAGKNYAAAH
jgi:hypothetical protein